MIRARSLLPKKHFKKHLRFLVMLSLILLVWVAYFIGGHMHDIKKKSIQSEIAQLINYKSTVTINNSSRKNLLFSSDLMSASKINLDLISLIKQYPDVTILRIKHPPLMLKPNENIEQRNLREMARTKPRPVTPYIRLLPNQKISLIPHHIEIKGPFGEMFDLLNIFIREETPIVVTQLEINGKNYPSDEVSLDLAFFSREKKR